MLTNWRVGWAFSKTSLITFSSLIGRFRNLLSSSGVNT